MMRSVSFAALQIPHGCRHNFIAFVGLHAGHSCNGLERNSGRAARVRHVRAQGAASGGTPAAEGEKGS
eukprot:scaffold250958_cov19-Prasinocladus_malaysianus.AAC.1